MYPALRRTRHTSATPLRAFFCTLGIGPYRPLLCVHRVFPRLQNTSFSYPPSPRGRLSRPQTTMRAPPRIRPSPVSTDSLCCYRQTACGSHVPVLNPWMLRCLLYPWWPWRDRKEGVACSQVRVYSYLPGGTQKPTRITPHSSRAITLRREVFHKYRGSITDSLSHPTSCGSPTLR